MISVLEHVDTRNRWPAVALVGGCLLAGAAAGLRPVLGIAAALGIAFLVVVLKDLTLGLVAFVVLSFLDVLHFQGGSLTLTKVAGVALCASWLARIATEDGRTRNDFFARHPGYVVFLGLFIGWVAMSALWAEDVGEVVTALQRYGLNMLLLPIVYAAVRERRHVTWILTAFVVGTIVSTAYGLLFPVPPDPGELSRLGGAVGDSNQTATVLVTSIVLCVALLGVLRRSALLSLAAGAAALVCLAGLVNTLSRTGLVSLGLAMVAGSVIGGRWRKYAIALAMVTAAGTFAYFVVLAPSSARDRVASSSSTGRSDLWKIALREAADHPIRGLGAGNFAVTSVHYLVRPGATTRADFVVTTPKVAHNIYLEELAELGVIGLALFVSIPLLSLRCAYMAARRFSGHDDGLELAARAVIVAIVGVLAAGYFVSGQYSKQLWLLLALGPALLALSERPTVE